MKTLSHQIRIQLVFVDVSSLFTKVLLDLTVDIMLRKLYRDKESEASIPSNKSKELWLLFTKNAHFSF